MAMTDAGMSAAIKSAIEAVFDIEDEVILQKFADAAGQAIVEYIKANAEVPAGIPVTTNTGSGATTANGTVI